MNIELKKLSVNDEKDIYDMLQKIPKEENGFENSVNGKTYQQYKDWLMRSNNISNGVGLQDGWVELSTYWLYVDNKPVGYGKLRHRLVDHLYLVGGHIGYSIIKSKRANGYGNLILMLLIKEAKKLSIDKLLLTIRNSNEASI